MPALAALSLPAIDTLWDDLQLGDLPFPLEVRCHGDTIDERARIKAGVYADLERRGLVGSGSPARQLDDALHLLARPEVSIDLVALMDMADDKPLKAVTAARGRRAALAVQRTRAIELTEVRDTAIVASIVELLPASRPGPGRSITLPASALKPGAHRGAEPGLLRTVTKETTNRPELKLIASILERPVLRAGQLGIMLRDQRGRQQRLPGIGWFDTDQGRYATIVKRGSDGEDWTTLSPVDNARLSHRLTETLVTALHG
jgi:hypothetical protein